MKNCSNCHFLAKEHRNPHDGRDLTFSLSAQERQTIASDINALPSHYILKCAQGVWDEGVANLISQRHQIINQKNRKNFCFHFPHHEGMLFQAAAELQRRQQENEQLKTSNLYTRIGLWLAAFGLFATAISIWVSKNV